MAVDAKQSAQKLCMQRFKLPCGLCACSAVPEPDLTAIAQYEQHQGFKTLQMRCGHVRLICAQRLSML